MEAKRYQAYGFCFRVERVGVAYMAVGRAAGRGPYVLDRLGRQDTSEKMQRVLDAWAERNHIRPVAVAESRQSVLLQGELLK